MANLAYLCIACFLVALVASEEGELKIDVLKTVEDDKCQRKSKRLDMLSMHYVGTLEDGTKFDSSADHGQPFSFQLGIGQVIKGWDQGLLDMCIGEKRKLTIPSSLGYGDQGAGEKIPPKATLIFEVELLDVQDGPKPENIFKKIDTDEDNKLSREEISAHLVELSRQTYGFPVDNKSEEHQKVVDGIFYWEDSDKDGIITHEEFTGPKHDEL
uniref:peptidylprolyl isomerase n=1 Tax=Crassostrea virginica TaxID=6565 RepID=A0A8B8DAA1_CRAVI|nr:FK506-binding protein 2-like isoform X1 [Crassostrea virginica]